MADIEIDLRAKILSEDTKIWRLFPGKTYRFLREFQDGQSVFLDFPGLLLPLGPFDGQGEDDDAVVLAALAYRDWAAEMMKFNRRGGEGTPPEKPSIIPADYSGGVLSKPSFGERAALVAFFGAAQQGDLIVVPDRIPNRRILIGELLEGPEHRTSAIAPEWYGSEVIPARPIHWFPVVDELDISRELSDVLRRPNAFTQLGRQFYQEIFDRSYGTYQFESARAAKLTTSGPDFTGNDNLDLSLLVRTVTVLSYYNEHGGRTFESLGDILQAPVPNTYVMSLGISVHSPGDFLLKMPNLLPLVFAAMFTLLSGANATEVPKPADIRVVNSGEAAARNPCTVEIDEKVRSIVGLMGYDLWKASCEQAQRLTEQPQVRSTSRVTRRQVR